MSAAGVCHIEADGVAEFFPIGALPFHHAAQPWHMCLCCLACHDSKQQQRCLCRPMAQGRVYLSPAAPEENIPVMAHAQAVQGLEMGHQAYTLCQGTSMLCMLLKLRKFVKPLSCHASTGCACVWIELTWWLSCCAGADPVCSSQPPGTAGLLARASAGVGSAERDVQDTLGGGAGGQDLQPERELADTEALPGELLLYVSGLNRSSCQIANGLPFSTST